MKKTGLEIVGKKDKILRYEIYNEKSFNICP